MPPERKTYQLDLRKNTAEELLPILFGELAEDKIALKAAISDENIDQIKSCNHKIRGLARNFHFDALLESCLKIDAALEDDFSEYNLNSVKEHFHFVEEEIKKALELARTAYDFDFQAERLN